MESYYLAIALTFNYWYMSYSELDHSPTEEVKKDPTLRALHAQLPSIRQAIELFKQGLEISEKVKMSLEALAPALEIQIFGLNSEVEQHARNQEETENAYASVVHRLEEQLRTLRQEFDEKVDTLQRSSLEEISELRKTVGFMNEELNKAIELTNIYQKLYHDLKDKQRPMNGKADKIKPANGHNLFHVFDID